MRKIAIVGSRDFTNYEEMKRLLKQNNISFYSDDVIISGGARGADTLAEKFAKEYRLAFHKYSADWEQHGKKAGYLRNEHMAEDASEIIAFWSGSSPGTRMMIDISKKLGKKVTTILI